MHPKTTRATLLWSKDKLIFESHEHVANNSRATRTVSLIRGEHQNHVALARNIIEEPSLRDHKWCISLADFSFVLLSLSTPREELFFLCVCSSFVVQQCLWSSDFYVWISPKGRQVRVVMEIFDWFREARIQCISVGVCAW